MSCAYCPVGSPTKIVKQDVGLNRIGRPLTFLETTAVCKVSICSKGRIAFAYALTAPPLRLFCEYGFCIGGYDTEGKPHGLARANCQFIETAGESKAIEGSLGSGVPVHIRTFIMWLLVG